MTIDVGDVTGSPQGTLDVADETARIADATLRALPQWRDEGLRDEAVAAISTVATRLAAPGPVDSPARRTDAYVLAALLMLNCDASSGALATDLVELLD